jgi:hypothetical protein
MSAMADAGDDLACIRNDAWLVRHYARGANTSIGRLRREQAILKFGLSCRAAFSKAETSSEFEVIVAEILDCLRPVDRRPF